MYAALKQSDYNSDSMLKKCGISITPEFTQVDGRVLNPPKLKAGNDEMFLCVMGSGTSITTGSFGLAG